MLINVWQLGGLKNELYKNIVAFLREWEFFQGTIHFIQIFARSSVHRKTYKLLYAVFTFAQIAFLRWL